MHSCKQVFSSQHGETLPPSTCLQKTKCKVELFQMKTSSCDGGCIKKRELILPDTEMSTLSQWRKGPWKGHYVTINIIPHSPEIDYFQPHYLDVTSNNPLSRKDLRKDRILQFSNLEKEDVGNWGQGYQPSQQKYSVQGRSRPWSLMHPVHK